MNPNNPEHRESSKHVFPALAALFLVGVAAWFGARIWTFDTFRPSSLVVGAALAIGLATSIVRADAFSRWFAVAISTGLAYSSFSLFSYLKSQDMAGAVFLIPAAIFCLCSCLLATSLLRRR
jgi:hypothetical protein